jgi:hypothetical protein
MKIQKAQGQSLKTVAICLKEPIFAHGALHVALSRSSDPANVSMCVMSSVDVSLRCRNVVHREVLDRNEHIRLGASTAATSTPSTLPLFNPSDRDEHTSDIPNLVLWGS